VIGIAGWAVIFTLLVVWQGFALADPVDSWPAISEMLRTVTHRAIGRWILFSVWLWAGWHIFVRGWRFFFRI
jgi:hypothetical protein